MKNPLTLAGIEPATFRFVAQHLNHCATAVPEMYSIYQKSYRYSPNYIYYVTNRLLFHYSDVLEVRISITNSFYSRWVI